MLNITIYLQEIHIYYILPEAFDRLSTRVAEAKFVSLTADDSTDISSVENSLSGPLGKVSFQVMWPWKELMLRAL